jgi:hypothetical protein
MFSYSKQGFQVIASVKKRSRKEHSSSVGSLSMMTGEDTTVTKKEQKDHSKYSCFSGLSRQDLEKSIKRKKSTEKL